MSRKFSRAAGIPWLIVLTHVLLDRYRRRTGRHLTQQAELIAAYLDNYHAAALRKIGGLTEGELRSSLLPSGWSPLELVRHLAHVERRWCE